jgi:hypothetical protein
MYSSYHRTIQYMYTVLPGNSVLLQTHAGYGQCANKKQSWPFDGRSSFIVRQTTNRSLEEHPVLYWETGQVHFTRI